MSNYHTSVLLSEVIDYLDIKPENKYIDATLGGGGHTREILKRHGKVLGLDVDEDALKNADSDEELKKAIIVRANFQNIDTVAKKYGFVDVSGILFDLGISSHQIDTPERGFSFQSDAMLDMRMDQSLSVSAKDLVNGLTQRELEELMYRLGEEFYAKKIAREIIRQRDMLRIETTTQLADVIRKAIGRGKKVHEATKVFQALRIAVNDELNVIRVALPKSFSLLKVGGRLLVISFHSLEDRIVKNTFKDLEKKGIAKIITKKPIIPGEIEITQNKRSRSAKLRVIEKTI